MLVLRKFRSYQKLQKYFKFRIVEKLEVEIPKRNSLITYSSICSFDSLNLEIQLNSSRKVGLQKQINIFQLVQLIH